MTRAGRAEGLADLVLRQVRAWEEQGAALAAGEEEGIRELHLEVTHRCDMKCVMCHHWLLEDAGPGLSARELRRLLDKSRLLDRVETVVVSGGEPWLDPEAVPIIALLRERFPKASLGVLSHLGSARLLEARLTELASLGVAGLWLGSSMDGVGAAHDRMRGRRGAFRGLEAGLDMLGRRFPGTAVSLNFTLTPDNASELWPCYAYARDRGLGFGAQLVVEHQGLPASRRFRWTRAGLSEAGRQIALILEDLCRSAGALEALLLRPLESAGLWARLAYWGHLRDLCLGSKPAMPDCMAGRRYAMLDPEGGLFFCPVFKHRKAGNCLKEGFDAAWRSPMARALAAELSRCRKRCWLNCVAHPALDRVLKAALRDEEVPVRAR
ncbi:MAG: radical SAM protein [Elusimicrobia bacterium]|nr:radical SAM protein [Elusimicrobiota bacterium]